MKANCRNCHFLSKEYRDNNGQSFVFSLTIDEREKVILKPDEVVASRYSLSCHMGVWDEGVSGTMKDRDSIINTIRRDCSCFFYPYHPAMLFDAARELQKRDSENKQLKKSNFYTRIGLWVAAGALVLNGLVELFKK